MFDNTPAHQSTLITDFLIKNGILTVNHSPDLAPCDFYLYEKFHLAMKEVRYANIEYIHKSTAAILNIISTDEMKMSSNSI